MGLSLTRVYQTRMTMMLMVRLDYPFSRSCCKLQGQKYNILGTQIYRNLHPYKEAIRVPGFLILSIEAPINFANITYLNERLVVTL